MEFIKKSVKGYKKTYVTSKGVRKNTKPNLTLYLGTNTPFEPEQEIILMDMELFNLIDSLLDLTNIRNDNIIDKINELKQFQTITPVNTKNSLEIQKLKDTINELETKLNTKAITYDKLNDELHQFKNLSLIDSNREKEYIKLIGYYEKLEAKMESYSLLNRIRNKDPKQEIPRPETPLLTKDNYNDNPHHEH